MPKLKCDVVSCGFNKIGLCSKHTISVDGPNSYSKKETECCSYTPVDHLNFSYEIADIEGETTLETEIHCDAKNCVFQRNNHCYADRVEIKHQSDRIGSKAIHQSMCKTFECIDK